MVSDIITTLFKYQLMRIKGNYHGRGSNQVGFYIICSGAVLIEREPNLVWERGWESRVRAAAEGPKPNLGISYMSTTHSLSHLSLCPSSNRCR
jgi:hypothetical protein